MHQTKHLPARTVVGTIAWQPEGPEIKSTIWPGPVCRSISLFLTIYIYIYSRYIYMHIYIFSTVVLQVYSFTKHQLILRWLNISRAGYLISTGSNTGFSSLPATVSLGKILNPEFPVYWHMNVRKKCLYGWVCEWDMLYEVLWVLMCYVISPLIILG